MKAKVSDDAEVFNIKEYDKIACQTDVAIARSGFRFGEVFEKLLCEKSIS